MRPGKRRNVRSKRGIDRRSRGSSKRIRGCNREAVAMDRNQHLLRLLRQLQVALQAARQIFMLRPQVLVWMPVTATMLRCSLPLPVPHRPRWPSLRRCLLRTSGCDPRSSRRIRRGMGADDLAARTTSCHDGAHATRTLIFSHCDFLVPLIVSTQHALIVLRTLQLRTKFFTIDACACRPRAESSFAIVEWHCKRHLVS